VETAHACRSFAETRGKLDELAKDLVKSQRGKLGDECTLGSSPDGEPKKSSKARVNPAVGRWTSTCPKSGA
jgi:hypothetical protein